jgi:hypothetical protein
MADWSSRGSKRKREGFRLGGRIRVMDPLKYLRPARFALIALLTLPCSLALAEDKAPPPASNGNYTMSIDFPGGPLSKLMALLNANKESQLSIIQPGGLDPVLPEFSVHNARIDAVIAASGGPKTSPPSNWRARSAPAPAGPPRISSPPSKRGANSLRPASRLPPCDLNTIPAQNCCSSPAPSRKSRSPTKCMAASQMVPARSRPPTKSDSHRHLLQSHPAFDLRGKRG